jgi:hypothetical protein
MPDLLVVAIVSSAAKAMPGEVRRAGNNGQEDVFDVSRSSDHDSLQPAWTLAIED